MEEKESFEKFRDDNFLAYNTLNEKTVMEYFYHSQYFDPSSLNQKRRKGVQISNNAEGLGYKLIYCNETSLIALSEKTPIGSQWNLPNQFGVFVIQKYVRDSKGTETPLECYYVLGGTIFKSPSLGALIRYRSLTAIQHLDSLLNTLTTMSNWSLIEGYSWGSDYHDDNMVNSESVTKSEEEESLKNQQTLQQTFLTNHKKRHCQDTLSKINEPSSYLSINDLYTKRICSDSNRIIEDCFSTFANASFKFNQDVDACRQLWMTEDQVWQEQQIKDLEKLQY